MNDGLRTDIFLRYSPEIIACACIFLSARELEIPLPENPPWYTIFGADEESIRAICIRIAHLYTHKTRPLEELEKIIAECRERIESERKKAKEASVIADQEPAKTDTINQEEIKKTAEQIKKISASIAKSQSKASPNVEPGHLSGHAHHSHHMTRHSSFNYNYYGHPGAYMDPYYAGYEHGYYGEMVYDSNLKRNKSASYLLPPHHKDYKYDYKKYPSDKIRSKEYQSVSRSRSRSRSRRPEKKSSKNRSRSRTVDSIENGDKSSKSPSRHKKKKSHHHRESREDRKRDKSRERKERERESRNRDGHHHRSSKHAKDKHENSDSRYIPICS
ncbi:cyclin-L2 isoform X2 [Brachionus plicatilis]|uniref:Cyclin-L2 isoform X2 n=1 Tax=Brachionus plicatilis TaxID=10195 RepID=A0A3M7RNN8_BRAPC|nr:cyclin-L2 isoform X2 [Brachionus plicatilis]